MNEEMYVAEEVSEVAEDVDPRWLKGNILTFLRSENPNFNEKWISRIVEVTSPETLESTLEQFSYYENSGKFQYLRSLVRTS